MAKLSSGKRAKREQSKIRRRNERKSKKQAAHYLRFGPKGTTSSNPQKVRRGPEWGKTKTNHHKNIAKAIDIQKHEQALEREEYRDSLSPQEQLHRLDQRLGKDIGATKERIKLNRILNDQSVETTTVDPEEKQKIKAKYRNRSKL